MDETINVIIGIVYYFQIYRHSTESNYDVVDLNSPTLEIHSVVATSANGTAIVNIKHFFFIISDDSNGEGGILKCSLAVTVGFVVLGF